VLHRTILLLDQASSSRTPSLGRGPQRSGKGWNQGVQEATITGRANRSRPTQLTTASQLPASRSPIAKGCALPRYAAQRSTGQNASGRTKALLSGLCLMSTSRTSRPHPKWDASGWTDTWKRSDQRFRWGQAPASWAWLDLTSASLAAPRKSLASSASSGSLVWYQTPRGEFYGSAAEPGAETNCRPCASGLSCSRRWPPRAYVMPTHSRARCRAREPHRPRLGSSRLRPSALSSARREFRSLRSGR
jgi:hypothetical protein